jgi:hypothetical protein
MLLCQIFNFKNMVRTTIHLVIFNNVKIIKNYNFHIRITIHLIGLTRL